MICKLKDKKTACETLNCARENELEFDYNECKDCEETDCPLADGSC